MFFSNVFPPGKFFLHVRYFEGIALCDCAILWQIFRAPNSVSPSTLPKWNTPFYCSKGGDSHCNIHLRPPGMRPRSHLRSADLSASVARAVHVRRNATAVPTVANVVRTANAARLSKRRLTNRPVAELHPLLL